MTTPGGAPRRGAQQYEATLRLLGITPPVGGGCWPVLIEIKDTRHRDA
jgi:hypothetical protein